MARAGVRLTSGNRTTALAGLALFAGSAVAWVGLAGYEPPMSLPGFLAGWTLMMTAMMLPSIAPLALLYRGSRTGLAIGYVAVWGATGLLPYVAMERDVAVALPIVLGLAGLYELSPLKTACLRRCRNAAVFLMDHYRNGPVRLGIEHGLWCIGCCAGLMVVLVLAAAMSLVWAALIGVAIFAQKVLPRGDLWTRLIGVGLLVAAIAVAVT